jgi:TonB family protein
MKRLLIIILVCAALPAVVNAQTSGVQSSTSKPLEAAQKSEAQSPDLLEAEKLNSEAVKLYKAGKFDEAAPLAKRVLQLRETSLAPNHDLIISALINLGEIYRARRKYGDAETYFQRILTAYAQASAPDPAAMSNVLDILAFLKYMQLNYGEAEKLYSRALALREQASAPDKLQIATSLYNLAEFYRLRGDYKKAEPLYQRSIEIKGNALGPKDKDVINSLEHFSCLYYVTNQEEKLKDLESQFSFLRKQDAAAADEDEILNGKAISLPRPEYSRTAKANRISGTVFIKVTIDETGKVVEARDMCAAHPVLVETALPAAFKAQFTPTLRAGVPVKVTGIITYKFVVK